MKLSAIRTPDTSGGQEVDLLEFPGVKVLIRPADDIEFRRANSAGLQPHQRTLRTGRFIDPAIQDRIVSRAIAKTILLGWKNIDDDEGKPLPYSKEKALEWAEDPAYTRFFRAVEKEADALAVERAGDNRDLGNS